MPLPTKFRFRQLDNIGAADAEEDRAYLKDCFIDIGALHVLRDCHNPQRIIVGRTGSGKSALILRLKEVEPHVIEVKPESLALAYISNSTILNFFSELGVRLDVFFKLLWRHVFAVEIIKHHFHIDTESNKKTFLIKIKDLFNDKKHEKALEYLETWGKTFWEETEYRINEVTNNFESELEASARAQFPGLTFGIDGVKKLSEQQKSEIVNKAQHVVNGVQIRQLSDIIDLIDNVLTDPQKKYYIVIDRLDENWIEDKLRYRLVRALIETVRDFNKIKCVKIIVSVRYDLLQRIFKVTRDAGYQEEKYDSMYLKLNWSKHYLGSLLDERINHLIQQRYTSQKVSYHDIMPNKIKKIDPLDYILERTFMRPRDLISFLNYCIQKSEDSPIISPKTIQNAEHEYSRFRLRSLADEWFADYPNLLEYAMILKGKPSHFQLSLLRKEDVEDFCLALSITKPEYNDDLSYAGSQVATGECHVEDFKKILIKVFYIVGLIGVKLEAYEQYGWSYNLPRYFADTEVDGTTKIAIHPMFYRAMGIKAS